MGLHSIMTSWNGANGDGTPDLRLEYLGDEALIDRVKHDSDTEAFTVLLKRHHDRVKNIARSRFRGEQDVQDVTNQTFMNIWRSAHTWNPAKGGRFVSWLNTIAYNAANHQFRKREKKPELNASDAFNEEEGPRFENVVGTEGDVADVAIENELKHRRMHMFLDALQTLPLKDREIINAYHVEGTSLPEIAEDLGISHAAARQSLYRARNKLKAAVVPVDEAVKVALIERMEL